MPALAWLTCKAFIEKLPQKEQTRLAEFLPEKEQKQLASLRFAQPDWIDRKVRIENALDLVHPSWILQVVYPAHSIQEIGFILAALDQRQASALKAQLPYPHPLPALTPLGKRYLRNDLLQKIPGIEDLVPLEALPESSLNILTTLSFKELLQLVFFLGLKELAQYLKLIIDKNRRKAIQTALSADEWAMLEQLSTKKEPLAPNRGTFDTWTGQPAQLRLLIEQRGINRLAKALFGEHDSLLWYVLHILDTARANFLHKLCTVSPSQATHDFLKAQVVDSVQALKR